MTRTALCVALVIILLVPSVPLMTGESEISNELHWESVEQFEKYPHSITVRIIDGGDTANDRYDQLVIDVIFDEKVNELFQIRSFLSSNKGSMQETRIKGLHELEKGEQMFQITYNGTDLYRGSFTFPYLLELIFTINNDQEGGYSSFLVHGEFTHLRYESPFMAGFEEEITYAGIIDDRTGLFSELNVTLSLFTKLRGEYTIVTELVADGKGQRTIEVPRVITAEEAGHVEKEVSLKVEESTEIEETPEGKRGEEGSEPTDRSGSIPVETGSQRNLDSGNITASAETYWSEPANNQVIETIILPLSVEKSSEIIHEVTLGFSGTQIHASSWNGPFVLTSTIYHKEVFIESANWVISGVQFSEFTPGKPLGLFTNDYSVESTGSGMNLTVGISVSEPATFTIAGEIYSDSIIEKIVREGNRENGEIQADMINGYAKVDQESLNDAVPRSQVTLRLDKGITSVTLTFIGVHQREELFIFLTISSVPTAGSDDLEIHLKPTEPTQSGFIEIEHPILKDIGVDTDHDGLYEYLRILGNVHLPVGRYRMEASLFSGNEGYEYKISTDSSELRIVDGTSSPDATNSGDQLLTSFKLQFKGEDIFRSGIDGPYIIIVYLIAENGTTYTMRDQSQHYLSNDFSHRTPEEGQGTEPEYSFTNESIFLHTDVFASEIQRNTPEIVYYYYTDMGDSMKFRVRFTRLIAYNDDGDGILEDGENAYETYLTSRTWTTSPVSHGVNSELGSHIRFSMSTPISLQAMEQSGTGPVNEGGVNSSSFFVPNWGQLTLHFLISNNSVYGDNFTIRGGEELKITVEIARFKDLKVNAVSIEQKILLEQDGRIVTEGTSNGEWGTDALLSDGIWGDPERPSPGADGECENGTITGLGYTNEQGEVMGYYSWDCFVVQNMENGSSRRVDVGSSSTIENGTVVLYLSYPISNDVESLVHDPSVGVIRENAPVLSVEVITDTLEANPWSYLMGLILASLVVAVTLGSGRSGRSAPGNGRVKEGGNSMMTTESGERFIGQGSETLSGGRSVSEWKPPDGHFPPPQPPLQSQSNVPGQEVGLRDGLTIPTNGENGRKE